MQSRAFGSHVLEQLESQYVVHVELGGTCCVQAPEQPTSRFSEVQLAVHPPDTWIEQSTPCEKSNAPQGSGPPPARASGAKAVHARVAKAKGIHAGARRRKRVLMMSSERSARRAPSSAPRAPSG